MMILVEYSFDLNRDLRQGAVRLIANQLFVDASLRYLPFPYHFDSLGMNEYQWCVMVNSGEIEAFAKVTLQRILADDILPAELDELPQPAPLAPGALIETSKSTSRSSASQPHDSKIDEAPGEDHHTSDAPSTASITVTSTDNVSSNGVNEEKKDGDDTHVPVKTEESGGDGGSDKKVDDAARLIEEKKKEAKEAERRQLLVQMQLREHIAKEKAYKGSPIPSVLLIHLH
jgi:hypothetical protein